MASSHLLPSFYPEPLSRAQTYNKERGQSETGQIKEWGWMDDGEWRYTLLVMKWISHQDERHSIGSIINGNYTCGEHSIIYRVVKLLRCTPETKLHCMSTIF